MKARFLPSLTLPLLFFAALAAPAAGQGETGFLYVFDVELPGERVVLHDNGVHDITITFHDLSRDNTNIVPGQPGTGGVMPHSASFEIVPERQDPGWIFSAPGSLSTVGGQTKTTTFQVLVTSQADDPGMTITVVARVRTQGGIYNSTATMQFFTLGIAGFKAPYGQSILALAPRETASSAVYLQNFASVPRTFQFDVGENPCGLTVSPPPGTTLAGRQATYVPFTVMGPDSRFDPLGMNSETCRIQILVHAADNPGRVEPVTVMAKLAPGVAIDPMLVFWVVAAAVTITLLVLLVRRRKEKVEEELLGKPQKPWTIPVEQVYLRELKARDPRAWYVVRHYLMEDEYRSALLWYKAYKKGTKGTRRKEALILRQERAYGKWKAKWAKRIAAPLKKADRYEAKLQRKLDRRARKAHRKALRAHKKAVAKLQAKHAKKAAAAKEAHAKAVAKAQKKGKPIPAGPDVPALALPPKPEPKPLALADHRWRKKAARFRRRRVREQGNLEVKFERKDARYLAKLARKVRRIARKLDDPDFVAEHPLLRDQEPVQAKGEASKASKQ